MTEPTYMNLKTYEDFEALRKTNPGFYFSGKVQMRMHRVAEQMGDKFWQTRKSQVTQDDFSSITSPPISSLDRQEKIAALERQLRELTEGATNDQA